MKWSATCDRVLGKRRKSGGGVGGRETGAKKGENRDTERIEHLGERVEKRWGKMMPSKGKTGREKNNTEEGQEEMKAAATGTGNKKRPKSRSPPRTELRRGNGLWGRDPGA